MSGQQAGAESEPSNAVVCEPPLPASWFRVPVPETGLGLGLGESGAPHRLYYYANIKTKQACWERPESDPYFVEAAVHCRFNRREHAFLRGLFDEEMANCGLVSIDGCRDMLLEAGERVSRKQLALLFKAYSGDVHELRRYPHFINVCLYAKTHNHRLSLSLLQRMWSRTKRAALGALTCGSAAAPSVTALSSDRERLGHWVQEHSELADRPFYRHTETQATSWEMPDEVRFYVEPTRLFPKVRHARAGLTIALLSLTRPAPPLPAQAIELLEFNNFQTLVMMYSEVNRDCSGFISEAELRLIIARIGLFVPRAELGGLFADRDRGGRGLLAFNELVDLVVHLLSRDGGVARPVVLETFRDLERAQDLSMDGETSSVGYFPQEQLVEEAGSVGGSDAGGRRVRFKGRRRSGAGHPAEESKDEEDEESDDGDKDREEEEEGAETPTGRGG